MQAPPNHPKPRLGRCRAPLVEAAGIEVPAQGPRQETRAELSMAAAVAVRDRAASP